MFKNLQVILLVAVIGTISTAQAGFYDGRIPTADDLLGAGFWYCSEKEDFKPPTDAKGVANFIKDNSRSFKFEKTDKVDTFRNAGGEFEYLDYTVNTKVDGLAAIKYIKGIDLDQTPLKIYEILRIEKDVLMWVWASEDEKGSAEYEPVNFKALKNGRIRATQSCVSEKALKDILFNKSGCSIAEVNNIFDTASFFKDVNKMSLQKKNPNCITCDLKTILKMGEKWADRVSCKSDNNIQNLQQSMKARGKK